MSKRARVTPEIIQRVKEIDANHPGLCRWEIGKQVGVSDATVKRILNNEYEIAGYAAVRVYKEPVNRTEDQVTLKDIYDELKQIREALTDVRNMLKYSFKG